LNAKETPHSGVFVVPICAAIS